MKLVSPDQAKLFYEEATKIHEKLISYFEEQVERKELDTVIECFEAISDLWDKLEINDKNWDIGDQLISEALGETIRYWDFDLVEQIPLCEELVELLGYPELTETIE